MAFIVPRGVMNHNPFNINEAGIDWDGLLYHPVLGIERRFAVFQTPAAGIRAGIVNFQTYQDKHACKTWAEIIDRQAPPNENETDKYKLAVSEKTGFNMSAPANMHNWADAHKMAAAVIAVECDGAEYEQAVWDTVRANLAHTFTVPDEPKTA